MPRLQLLEGPTGPESASVHRTAVLQSQGVMRQQVHGGILLQGAWLAFACADAASACGQLCQAPVRSNPLTGGIQADQICTDVHAWVHVHV